jgi:hypothetical protein
MSSDTDDMAALQSLKYALDPTQFAALRRRVTIAIATAGPLMIAGVWYLDGRVSPRRDLFDFVFLPLIAAWAAYRQIQREREKWTSLVLELRGDCLIRTLPGFPTLEIRATEVTEIIESARGILIRTESRMKCLFVNRSLLGYEDFRAKLTQWAPGTRMIQAVPSFLGPIKNAGEVLACFLLFGGPLYLMYTPHRVVILPFGIALMISFIVMILYYQRSPNMPSSFRKSAWVLVALPLLAMITRLW